MEVPVQANEKNEHQCCDNWSNACPRLSSTKCSSSTWNNRSWLFDLQRVLDECLDEWNCVFANGNAN